MSRERQKRHSRRGRLVVRLVRLVALAAAFFVGSLMAPSAARGSILFGRPARQPTRVLLIGDSIMTQSSLFVEAGLHDQIAAGRLTVVTQAVPGSGLLSKAQYPWDQQVERLSAGYRPDVVVILFVGNCPAPLRDADGPELTCDTPGFFIGWADAAARATRVFESRGSRVVWVLPPPMAGAARQAHVDGVSVAYRAVGLAHPAVTYVDGRRALGGPGGEFEAQLPGPDGTPVAMRTTDGVHLTPAGSQRMAAAILAAIRHAA